MPRNLEREIDELTKQVEELKLIVTGNQYSPKQKSLPEFAGHIGKIPDMHLDPDIMRILDRLENECGHNGETGRVTYLGVFSSGGRQSTWIRDAVNTGDLLQLIENQMAGKVLSCIGNSERLNILLALLREPMTVAALVERYGFKSTGQVYHHLKPLLSADLIIEDKASSKGTYIVRPHRVQGIIMLLAGIREMIGLEHSNGNWDAEIHKGATSVDERYMADAKETQSIINSCFASLDPLTLKRFPPKEKKKIIILRVISEMFEAGKRYSEKEVNEILKTIYEDFATIRRYLITYGFMERTRDCNEYWLKN